MIRSASWLLPLIVGLLSSSSALGSPIFSYAFDHSSYTVPVGRTVNVTVFLQEIDNSSPESLPNGYLATTGLFGAGVLLNYSGQPARVLHNGDVTPNAAFLQDPTGTFSDSVTSAEAILLENVGLGPFVTAAGSGPVYDIKIGIFTFTGLSPGTATILATVTGSGGDLVGGDGTILDSITASGDAQVFVVSPAASLVPEPPSIGMFVTGSLLLIALAGVKRNRRRHV
jgi:hypothetical protein